MISAFALRVRDAQHAFRRALELGAWEIPVRAQAMELNIPAIHGVGESLIYFVDRYDEFSIYDVDFRAIPTVDPHPPAVAGMHFFGIVQYVGPDRTADWTAFYSQLMGFRPLPHDVRFGIMPSGLLLESPCRNVLPAADRARGRGAVTRRWTSTCSGSASARRTCSRRWRRLEKRGIEFLATEKVRRASAAP